MNLTSDQKFIVGAGLALIAIAAVYELVAAIYTVAAVVSLPREPMGKVIENGDIRRTH